jgi:hypothetical protein
MDHSWLGRILLYIGLVIVLAGILVMFAEKIPFLGRLPGDIVIKREHFNFYFPLTTCLVISLVLTLLFRFFGRH